MNKKLYHLADEHIHMDDDFFEDSPVIRRGNLYHSTSKALKKPIYPKELIVGDVPYHEFKANRELMPPFMTPEEKSDLVKEAKAEYRGIVGEEPENFAEMRNFFHFGVNHGHLIADYALFLNIGINGMKARVEQSLSEATDKKKQDFLLAAKITLDGASLYINDYAEEVAKLVKTTEDEDEKNLLESIAENCRYIATEPPETFWQAVQLLWFMQLLMEIESGISAFSYGRADQYLARFLKTDIEAGRINYDEAQKIMDSFFVKNNEQNMLTNDAGRALTIGGIRADGMDGVNDVTYLMLDSAIRLRLLQPKLNARIHKNSPAQYISLCSKGAAQNAGIQMYNDDVILRALETYGYPYADAVEYGMIGCYEYGLAGIDRPSPMSGTFHLAACLEEALYNDAYESYDALEAAFTKRVAHWADKLRLNMLFAELTCRKLRPLPFLSNFVGDCIKNAEDINSGGARYKTCGVRFTGFSAVSDSLTAIKILMFDNKLFTKEQLLDALKNDFADCEPLRLTLLNKAPKYGNDDDAADMTAIRVGEICCNEILKLQHIDGAKLRPGLFSFSNFLEAGRRCGALPNGRKAGEPFVNGVCPMHGADMNGPTAMLASAAKLNYSLSPNGTTLDLKLPSSVYGDDSGFERLGAMVRAYFDMGGAHIQAYTLSASELELAKKEPEKYANVIVRVTGYSAYFTTLDNRMQDEIIKRTVNF